MGPCLLTPGLKISVSPLYTSIQKPQRSFRKHSRVSCLISRLIKSRGVGEGSSLAEYTSYAKGEVITPIVQMTKVRLLVMNDFLKAQSKSVVEPGFYT